MNNLLLIEILQFGAIDENMCSVDLVECTDVMQKLSIIQALPLSSSWLSMDHFSSNTNDQEFDGFTL
jgi:hypothetical protein